MTPMINISHGTCDICLQEQSAFKKAEPSEIMLTINNKQLEFCSNHFKKFVDEINKAYEKFYISKQERSNIMNKKEENKEVHSECLPPSIGLDEQMRREQIEYEEAMASTSPIQRVIGELPPTIKESGDLELVLDTLVTLGLVTITEPEE